MRRLTVKGMPRPDLAVDVMCESATGCKELGIAKIRRVGGPSSFHLKVRGSGCRASRLRVPVTMVANEDSGSSMSTRAARPRAVSTESPAVPLTIEGYSVLHQMMRVRWPAWRELSATQKNQIASEASAALSKMEQNSTGQSGCYSLLGHKGDLMLVHFRQSFDDLNRAELQLAQLRLSDYLEPTTSYLSIIELGLYESTTKVYKTLSERGIEPHSEEWKREIQEVHERQKEAMHPRLFPELPKHRYICFYPMDRRRGEDKNWYTVPIEERARQMGEHGLVGRRYAGEVKQIITGSIGFDDWEWGVDLWADDPLVFKRLIYEMRFDEVSAVYALFGHFYMGVRVPANDLSSLMSGKLPSAPSSQHSKRRADRESSA